MRGCPAVMSIHPELLGNSAVTAGNLHLPCLHRTSPCTHSRAEAVSSLGIHSPMPLLSITLYSTPDANT
jgi:hypothetical protein